MSPKGGKKKKPKKKTNNTGERAHTRSLGPPKDVSTIVMDAPAIEAPAIEGDVDSNGQPTTITVVDANPPTQREDQNQRDDEINAPGVNIIDNVGPNNNMITSDEEAVEETKEDTVDKSDKDIGAVEELKEEQPVLEGAGVDPVDEGVLEHTTAKSIHIDGTPPKENERFTRVQFDERFTQVHLDNSSEDSIQQPLFDDKP
jgi:hypothetical protein